MIIEALLLMVFILLTMLVIWLVLHDGQAHPSGPHDQGKTTTSQDPPPARSDDSSRCKPI